MDKLAIQKNRITIDKIIETIAFSNYKLQKCKKCGMFAQQDDIKFLHPLLASIDGDRFMCSACYDENVDIISKML